MVRAGITQRVNRLKRTLANLLRRPNYSDLPARSLSAAATNDPEDESARQEPLLRVVDSDRPPPAPVMSAERPIEPRAQPGQERRAIGAILGELFRHPAFFVTAAGLVTLLLSVILADYLLGGRSRLFSTVPTVVEAVERLNSSPRDAWNSPPSLVHTFPPRIVSRNSSLPATAPSGLAFVHASLNSTALAAPIAVRPPEQQATPRSEMPSVVVASLPYVQRSETPAPMPIPLRTDKQPGLLMYGMYIAVNELTSPGRGPARFDAQAPRNHFSTGLVAADLPISKLQRVRNVNEATLDPDQSPAIEGEIRARINLSPSGDLFTFTNAPSGASIKQNSDHALTIAERTMPRIGDLSDSTRISGQLPRIRDLPTIISYLETGLDPAEHPETATLVAVMRSIDGGSISLFEGRPNKIPGSRWQPAAAAPVQPIEVKIEDAERLRPLWRKTAAAMSSVITAVRPEDLGVAEAERIASLVPTAPDQITAVAAQIRYEVKRPKLRGNILLATEEVMAARSYAVPTRQATTVRSLREEDERPEAASDGPEIAAPQHRPAGFNPLITAVASASQPATPERVSAPTETPAAPAPTPEAATTVSRPSASVSRPSRTTIEAATTDDAVNLRENALIGVFGTEANRRAIVRLANGRLIQVRIGDKFNGWTVIAIGESAIQIQRGRRSEVLEVPG